MINNEERIKIFEKWAELDEEKEALYGTKVAWVLEGFEVTYFAVEKNYQDLLSAFNSYENNPRFLELGKSKRSQFFNEFSRLMLNYLSSTYSLLNQFKKYTEKINKENIFKSKMTSFWSNDCFCFCRCLRHIVQHMEQLALMEHFSRVGIKEGKPPQQSIILRKKTLLELQNDLYPKVEHDGFVRYITSNKDVNLRLPISEYHNLIQDFYVEFTNKMRELYASDLQKYETIKEKIYRLQKKLD